eukprot:contig_35370_g8485
MAFATPFSGAALSTRAAPRAAVSRTPPTASLTPTRAAAAAILAAALMATAPGVASAGIFSEQAVQQAPETAKQVFENTASAGNQAGRWAEHAPGACRDGEVGGGCQGVWRWQLNRAEHGDTCLCRCPARAEELCRIHMLWLTVMVTRRGLLCMVPGISFFALLCLSRGFFFLVVQISTYTQLPLSSTF